MRDLKKTKSRRFWNYGNGEGYSKCFAEIRVGKRGAEYFCLWIEWDLTRWFDKKLDPQLYDARDLHMTQLRDAAQKAVTIYEENNLPAEWLESLLDFIYAEINRRVNKTLKE